MYAAMAEESKHEPKATLVAEEIGVPEHASFVYQKKLYVGGGMKPAS